MVSNIIICISSILLFQLVALNDAKFGLKKLLPENWKLKKPNLKKIKSLALQKVKFWDPTPKDAVKNALIKAAKHYQRMLDTRLEDPQLPVYWIPKYSDRVGKVDSFHVRNAVEYSCEGGSLRINNLFDPLVDLGMKHVDGYLPSPGVDMISDGLKTLATIDGQSFTLFDAVQFMEALLEANYEGCTRGKPWIARFDTAGIIYDSNDDNIVKHVLYFLGPAEDEPEDTVVEVDRESRRAATSIVAPAVEQGQLSKEELKKQKEEEKKRLKNLKKLKEEEKRRAKELEKQKKAEREKLKKESKEVLKKFKKTADEKGMLEIECKICYKSVSFNDLLIRTIELLVQHRQGVTLTVWPPETTSHFGPGAVPLAVPDSAAASPEAAVVGVGRYMYRWKILEFKKLVRNKRILNIQKRQLFNDEEDEVDLSTVAFATRKSDKKNVGRFLFRIEYGVEDETFKIVNFDLKNEIPKAFQENPWVNFYSFQKVTPYYHGASLVKLVQLDPNDPSDLLEKLEIHPKMHRRSNPSGLVFHEPLKG